MQPLCPHLAVIIYYTYKLLYFFSGSMWLHISYGFYFLSIGFMPSRVTQKPKYSISVFLQKGFFISYLGPFSFSLSRVNYNFSTWSVQSPFVSIISFSIYARISSIPWNKSFILCWKMFGKLLTTIGRRLYQYFSHGRIIVHKLLEFSLS